MSKPSVEELDKLEAALAACVRITKRPGYWEDFTKRAGIPIDRPAAAILITLSQQSCQFQALVAKLGIEAPSVSRKVHSLEDQGLVVRKSTADKRVHELHLSAEGESLAVKLKQAKRQALSELVSDWSEKERLELINSLDRFAKAMKQRFEENNKPQ